MNTCPNCGKMAGLHSSILQGCTCQWQMAAPPQRQWVGLTDEEIWKWFESNTALNKESALRIARVIEAKLKEKNT